MREIPEDIRKFDIPGELTIDETQFLADKFRQAYADYVRTVIEPGETLPYSQHLRATEVAVRAVIRAREA